MLSLVLPILSLGAVLNVPDDYADIRTALDAAVPFDTIALAPGYYSGDGFKFFRIDTLLDQCITIMSTEGPELTTIDLENDWFMIVGNDGLRDNSLLPSVPSENRSIYGVKIRGITFTLGAPVMTYESWGDLEIRDCIITHSQYAITVGYHGFGEVFDCTFRDNATAMVLDEYPEFFSMSGCVFVGNETGILCLGANVDLVGNIFVDNIEAVWSQYSDIGCFFSVFYDNWYGVRNETPDWSVDLQCNDIYGNIVDYVGVPDPIGINGNISRDPLFCDTTFSTLGVASISPLLPEHNDCGVNIGNVSIGCYCGDINASGQRDISDLTFLVSYMFDGGLPPDPSWAGDVDGSGGTDISDVTYYVDYLFNSGPDPKC
jgi:hypothetical protein